MHHQKILIIKSVHTVIFFFMVFCLLYVLYCAIARRYDWTLLAALGAIFIEGLALLLNRWECPFTTLVQKYGDENGSVTYLFLPAWLARHTFKVSAVLLTIEVIWLGIGYFTK